MAAVFPVGGSKGVAMKCGSYTIANVWWVSRSPWSSPGVFAGSSISSQPAGQSIVVDGDCSDWEGIELQYFGEGIRTVGLTHDADHLYVMWRYGDERVARQVLARGVTVWVNGDGKKKDVVGVRYPGSEAIAEALPPLEGDQLPPGVDEDRARRMRQELTVREPGFITIFEGEIETDLPEESESGPAAASGFTTASSSMK